MLSSEQGVYVAETIGAKHTKPETVLTFVYSMLCVLYFIRRSTFSILYLVISPSCYLL